MRGVLRGADAVTIKAVFRVQCDGPCRGWLSLPDGYRMGTDILHVDLVVRPTAATAGLWPGERAARRAALRNGWHVSGRNGRVQATNGHAHMLCPTCKLNPLDIRIPEAAPCLGTHDTWSICRECA